MTTWTLTGFGDEIAANPAEQLDVLDELGIRWLDLRGAWDKNVLAFDDEEIATIRALVDQRGFRVSCIATPIGKTPVDAPLDDELARMRRAIEIAQRLNVRFLRVFSWYIPVGDDPVGHRDEVLRRLGALVKVAQTAGVTLLHENEGRIYGDTPDRCRDLLESVGSPRLRAIWDPANFIAAGRDIRPHDDGFALLRPFIAATHVKDFDHATGRVVVAGAGDAQWPETIAALANDGFDGFWTLEPHLAVAGQFGGFTGPEGFRQAAGALRGLLSAQGVDWN